VLSRAYLRTGSARTPPVARPVASALQASPITRRSDALVPKSLAELLSLPPEQLDRVDIALTNLLCSEGLPGSEGLDAPAVLATLDKWAEAVALETARSWPQFLRDPGDYENSEGYFKALVLVTVLERDLGVRYNLERADQPDFRNSKDQFIHGMVNDANGGTCVSMPVLDLAVGRRLGYPLKLALAREHVFWRWDDGRSPPMNFNNAGRGLTSDPDEFYRSWPRPIGDEDLKHREFLVSLTPAEELAVFLAARGHCLMANRRYKEALVAYRAAADRHPSATAYRLFIAEANAALNPPILVQPGPPRNPWANFGMPDPPMPRR
jgi:tetratricopeptide (TPR) repeat protein